MAVLRTSRGLIFFGEGTAVCFGSPMTNSECAKSYSLFVWVNDGARMHTKEPRQGCPIITSGCGVPFHRAMYSSTKFSPPPPTCTQAVATRISPVEEMRVWGDVEIFRCVFKALWEVGWIFCALVLPC